MRMQSSEPAAGRDQCRVVSTGALQQGVVKEWLVQSDDIVRLTVQFMVTEGIAARASPRLPITTALVARDELF